MDINDYKQLIAIKISILQKQIQELQKYIIRINEQIFHHENLFVNELRVMTEASLELENIRLFKLMYPTKKICTTRSVTSLPRFCEAADGLVMNRLVAPCQKSVKLAPIECVPDATVLRTSILGSNDSSNSLI